MSLSDVLSVVGLMRLGDGSPLLICRTASFPYSALLPRLRGNHSPLSPWCLRVLIDVWDICHPRIRTEILTSFPIGYGTAIQ